MKRLIFGLPICLVPAISVAQALPLTVGEMQRACSTITDESRGITPENAVAVGACFGAMRGVVQVMQANCRSVAAGQRPAPALAVGEIPTSGDAIGAFDAWAEANPDKADAPAEYGIIHALATAFPCVPAVRRATPPPDGTDGRGEPAPEAGGAPGSD